jgi:hypothetical protein
MQVLAAFLPFVVIVGTVLDVLATFIYIITGIWLKASTCPPHSGIYKSYAVIPSEKTSAIKHKLTEKRWRRSSAQTDCALLTQRTRKRRKEGLPAPAERSPSCLATESYCPLFGAHCYQHRDCTVNSARPRLFIRNDCCSTVGGLCRDFGCAVAQGLGHSARAPVWLPGRKLSPAYRQTVV